MRIIAKRTLRLFWESSPEYEDSKGQLKAWHSEVAKADWSTAQDVKAQFRSASIVKRKPCYF